MKDDELRILYIEDNPDDVELLRAYLAEENGGRSPALDSVGTLEQGLKRAGQGRVDAVLLDLNLPDSRGLETFERFTAAFPDLPVIVVTVLDRKEAGIQAVRAGAQDYLIKDRMSGPLSVRAVRYAVERKEAQVRILRERDSLETLVGERTRELTEANLNLRAEVAERHQSRKKIQEQKDLLQSILSGIEAGVFVIDMADHRIVEVNAVGAGLLGLDEATLVGRKCQDFICVEKRKAGDGPCPALGRKTLHAEFRLERPDGRVLSVSKSVVPVTIDGRPHRVAILFDISDRKNLERQLAVAQKLESVGQLASGIAHEINTPVQYIGGNLDFLRMVLERVEAALDSGIETEGSEVRDDLAELRPLMAEARKSLDESLEGVDRIRTIVQAMKRFSHPDLDALRMVDVNEAVQTTATIARNEWKYVADLKTDLAPHLPPILCIPGDLNQALLNVVVNAAQAIGEVVANTGAKGLITIRTALVGEMVEITITDTGCGIPDRDADRVFDPFFTTKEVGRGTGQGLAITYAAVTKHGGTIDFDSTMGKGTTFRIRLPMGGGHDDH